VPLLHLVMPVLFRTIYACGLRRSEPRLLRVEDVDVDVESVLLQIRDTKGGKYRQLPVSEPLRERARTSSGAAKIQTTKLAVSSPSWRNSASTSLSQLPDR
jgi:integrase